VFLHMDMGLRLVDMALTLWDEMIAAAAAVAAVLRTVLCHRYFAVHLPLLVLLTHPIAVTAAGGFVVYAVEGGVGQGPQVVPFLDSHRRIALENVG